MDRTTLLQETRALLASAGFVVSGEYDVRLAGFDLVARRHDTLVIVKVLANIDSFTEDVAQGLQKLAVLLDATPLLIGEKNGINPLEHHVVYDRFGVRAITLPTLERSLREESPLKAYAGPGGLYVSLDGDRLRRIREERKMSLGELARSVRVSRRTVQMYEDGMSARIDVATRIEEYLETPVTTPIDLLQRPATEERLATPAPSQDFERLKSFQRQVVSLLDRVGYTMFPMDRCPFEALGKERERILLACIQEYNERLRRKAEVLAGLAKITEKQAVVFLDREIARRNLAGTPVIMKRDLRKIADPDDVSRLIAERSSE